MLYQGFIWLKTDEWIEHSTKKALAAFEIIYYDDPVVRGWEGLNRIVEWFLDFHPLPFFFVLTVMVVILAACIWEAKASD